MLEILVNRHVQHGLSRSAMASLGPSVTAHSAVVWFRSDVAENCHIPQSR